MILNLPYFYINENLIYNNNNNSKKRVSFNNKIHIIIIPNIDDYKYNKIIDLLWWSDDDYNIFKNEAIKELNIILQNNKIMDINQAKNLLYQT